MPRLSDSGLSTGAAVVITFAVTFIVSVTVTAIITFIVAYICVKRTLEKSNNARHKLNKASPQDQAVYEQVRLPSHTVTKNDLELQPNPAYGTSHKVTMDTNPAYESCKCDRACENQPSERKKIGDFFVFALS